MLDIKDITNTIIQGDCLEVMKRMPDNCVDTIITDPPYGLSFMGKKWDYDVPAVEVWVEALRVLKPGGTLLCFAGSRTQHRMAVNVEDAGFILKDCIMWLYGSGFPKATDISKQLDKGHKREVIATKDVGHDITNGGFKDGKTERKIMDITEPATPEAILWNGWKSHGLKPAYEPILVAMKPNDGTYANNALVHGVSGLNIDGGRIPTTDKLGGGAMTGSVGASEGWDRPWRHDDEAIENKIKTTIANVKTSESLGRFPANVILDEEAGAMLDEQTGQLTSGSMKKPYKYTNNGYSLGQPAGETKQIHESNSGGASRFFYCAKASKKERNAGCGGTGTGTKHDATFRDCETTEWAQINGNHHPTVKPLALMEYLCTLTKTPTGGIVLEPYAGSGTTLVACAKTGRDYIGIEREAEYCEIARKRVQEAKDSMGLFK